MSASVFEHEDELQACLAAMRIEGKASTSFFQRRRRLGYVRAKAIIDEMERRGYIAPIEGGESGSAPRRILRYDDNPAPEPPEAPTPEYKTVGTAVVLGETGRAGGCFVAQCLSEDGALELAKKLNANAALRAGLAGMLASATPSKTEHPAMFAAWQAARALLAPEGGK